jgi:feruloyl esterase
MSERDDGIAYNQTSGGLPVLKKILCTPLLMFVFCVMALAQMPCERLRSLKLQSATITAAVAMPKGPYLPAGLPSDAAQYAKVQIPAYCRVAAVLTPTADSHIEIELWMPAPESWNRKYQAVGGGGWVGSFNLSGMLNALQQGYATSSTDTGHKGPEAAFAVGHPEKLVDFAYRAVHEMTAKSKAIMMAFYGGGPRFSYWNGCSTGGRQGIMEAVRYPEDFDGIIAGAPANNQFQLGAWRINLDTTIRKDPRRIVPRNKMLLVNRAVLEACDTLDGVKDGLLSDPMKCHFDPSTLLCRGAENENCLTAAQGDAVKMAYEPVKKRNGELIYPGLVPGGEADWPISAFNGASDPGAIDLGIFRYVAHEDPTWDWRTFDLERDTALALEKAGYVEVTDPDLQAFKAHGGKLLIYHGWNDGGTGGAISPLNSVNYYSSVLEKMGPHQDDWLRLFMVPGMDHCGGGPGPNQFAVVTAMETWREQGKAPDQITAYRVSNDRVNMSRPLCPYPQVAVYKGTGDTNLASNFVCKSE